MKQGDLVKRPGWESWYTVEKVDDLGVTLSHNGGIYRYGFMKYPEDQWKVYGDEGLSTGGPKPQVRKYNV